MRRRRWIGPILAWLVAAASVAAEAQTPSPERVLARAERELSRGRADFAIHRLERALRGGPHAALALRYAELALPLTRTRDPSTRRDLRVAERILRMARALAAEGPEDRAARKLNLYAAWSLAWLARWEEALDVATSAGEREDPLTADALRSIAARALWAGELALAERTVSLARQFMPANPQLASDHGLLLLALGRAEAALSPLAERWAVDRNNLLARQDFAYALLAAGRAQDALNVLQRVEAACRARASCLHELTRAALEAELGAGAVDLALTLTKETSESPSALFLLAEAHTRVGAFGEARETYRRILASDPSNRRAAAALETIEAKGQ